MTFQEAQQALCRKLDISYADIAYNGLFSLTDIKEFVNTGARIAWDYKPWDFAEFAKTGTLTPTEIANGYLSFPQDLNASSIQTFVVNGELWNNKLSHADYLAFKQKDPTSTEKVWCEWNNIIFFNVNAASSGQTIDVYGKQNFQERSADADLMPFSLNVDSQGNSGNDAVIFLAYAEALGSEKKKNPTQAQAERATGISILESLFKTLSAGRTREQNPYTPMFEVPDFFGNGAQTDNGKFRI
jgi:hypothetical protein